MAAIQKFFKKAFAQQNEDKLQNGKIYIINDAIARDYYPKYTNNSYNSIFLKKSNQKIGRRLK